MIKLAGYKIIKKIGSGGMGDVYLAEHEKLEKKVAIKSLHKNLVSNTDFRKRFSQEAKTHAKLDHPNIVKLLDYQERKDGLFLIMEYVDGQQLDQHIKKNSGPIPEQDLIPLFTQVLDAIGYAHKQGLIHRDIKPSNIMIDQEDRIKVLDFGIAKLQEEEKGLTKTGMQIGTASYMSPEQVNTKKVNKLTDIYSLGVTLFYMAVGKSPYDGETNTFNIQTKIVSEDLPLASEVYPGVSKKIESIIIQATQKKKADRYQSCQEFKDDLYKNVKIKKISSKKSNKRVKREQDSLIKTQIKDRIKIKINLALEIIKKQPAVSALTILLLLFVVAFCVLYSEYKTTESIYNDKDKLYWDLRSQLSGDDYNSGCDQKIRLKLHNHTYQTLRFWVSWKEKNGEWSQWGYWDVN